MSNTIVVKKISLKSLSKLLELGYCIIISDPEANVRKVNPKIPYVRDPKPTFLPTLKHHRMTKMYEIAYKRGLIK